MAAERHADADAVVAVLLDLELEPQDEVAVFLLRKQHTAVCLRAEDHAVLNLIARPGLLLDRLPGLLRGKLLPGLWLGGRFGRAFVIHPTGEVFAVQQRLEPDLILRGNGPCRGRENQR